MITLLFMLFSYNNACDCNVGICQGTTCYCQAPYVGEHCDYLIDYQYGMQHGQDFNDFVGHDLNYVENDCHSNCNNQGFCINGQCHCQSPYGGQHCQLKIEFLLNDTVQQQIDNQQSFQLNLVNEIFVQQLDTKAMYKKCPTPCRNDGQCVYGQCMCISPYVGDYCQYIIQFEYGTPHYQVVILCIFCLILGAALVIVIFIILKIRDEAKKKYELISAENKDEWKKP